MIMCTEISIDCSYAVLDVTATRTPVFPSQQIEMSCLARTILCNDVDFAVKRTHTFVSSIQGV